MITVKEISAVEQKLKALYHLQRIDSKVDEIKRLRGELPIEVSDLEDEIEGLLTRNRNLDTDINELQSTKKLSSTNIEQANALIAKYEKQQMNVKNNREFEALTREIEMQKLEIQLSEKRIRDAQKDLDIKNRLLSETQFKLENKRKELEAKKKELEVIISETQKEEEVLLELSSKSVNDIETRWFNYYNRIRGSYKNGLAVAVVERDSCGGCFGKIPPQRQLEIRQHKKVLLCEHCGRILIDAFLRDELEEEKPM